MKLTKNDADRIHLCLDEILEHSDSLYKLLKDPGGPGPTRSRGFGPSHDLNSAVSQIRGLLQLSGYKKPK